MAIKTVSEGMTNAYLVHGFGVLVLGGAMFAVSWMIAVPVIICAIALFVSTTGLQIDPEKKLYRTFMSLFGYKIGTWKSFSDVTEVILVLSTERKTIHGLIPGAMPIGRSATLQVRTYDLLINDGIGSVEVNDFLTYKNARIGFDSFTETLKIDGRDFVAEKLASNRAKRSR